MGYHEKYHQLRTDIYTLTTDYQQRITVLEQTRADTNDPNRKRDCTDRISMYQSFISKLSQLTEIKSE